MITQKLQRVGDRYVVTIPEEEVARQDLREGDIVEVAVRKLADWPELSPELQAAAERSWEAGEAAYRYLAER